MTAIQAAKTIKRLTRPDTQRLERLIANSALTYNYSNQRLAEIESLINQIYTRQTQILNTLTVEAYSKGRDETIRRMGATNPPPIDRAAVNVLIRDTIRDLQFAVDSSKTYLRSIFKLAKQDIISETTLTETVLDTLMNEGNFRDAADDLSIEIMETGSTDKTKLSKLDDSQLRARVARAKASMVNGKGFPQYLDTTVFKRIEKKLSEGNFITIINKNGKPMTFSLDYYSGLVARTRFADSQVQGSLDAGKGLDVELYLVSDHNTDSKICKTYENKFLSTDPNLIGRRFEGRDILRLDEKSKPLYHPNCKHRLLAFPLTESEYESIVGGKSVAA